LAVPLRQSILVGSRISFLVEGTSTMTMLSLTPLAIKGNKDYVDQVMVGTLLGDRSLVKKYEGGGTYYKFAQSTKHSDYLHHIFNLFKDCGYVNMEKPNEETSVLKGGGIHKWLQFTTKSLVEWNKLKSQWYVNNVKVIPVNIELTPISLAYWFMDDGGWTGKAIHLSTNSFTREDTLRLIDILSTQFNLKCSLHSRNRIYIWARSCPDFINIVKPYIHSGMRHKLSSN
jgi:hypothetical protein